MQNKYEVYINRNGDKLTINADGFDIDEKTLEFYEKIDKYTTKTLAVFNFGNILGFKEI
jgi:hypothetical protein